MLPQQRPAGALHDHRDPPQVNSCSHLKHRQVEGRPFRCEHNMVEEEEEEEEEEDV